MENISVLSNKEEGQINLPPGFRFHPTNEELLIYYLYKKTNNANFSAIAIAEVDIQKFQPWDLPWKAKMGEDEWYFFCLRDKKYQTGLRTNRATEAGYWKSTGKDVEIYRGKCLIGKKKTLVFYLGRAPTGEKTNWVMHEYRLDGNFSVHNSSRPAKNEWVICRVFEKTSGGKKTHISDKKRFESIGNGLGSSSVSLSPPVVAGHYMGSMEPTMSTDSAHVPCFSSLLWDDDYDQAGIFNSAENSLLGICSNPQIFLPTMPLHDWSYSTEPIIEAPMNLPLLSDSALTVQEQNFLDGVFENQGFMAEAEQMLGVSHETNLNNTELIPEISSVISSFGNQQNPSSSSGASLDLDNFWSY
ncbi:hypothetical protein K1719_031479 [Acacia pycnantha]|nr:hypothetical protein K1719_031479 [Acacia pycnantha]